MRKILGRILVSLRVPRETVRDALAETQREAKCSCVTKYFLLLKRCWCAARNDGGYDKIITYDIRYRQFRKSG
jgi:hypothetical protein